MKGSGTISLALAEKIQRANAGRRLVFRASNCSPGSASLVGEGLGSEVECGITGVCKGSKEHHPNRGGNL